MTRSSGDVVVCGAGIAGISAAYHLAVRHGVKRVVLVDEREPMTLTSDNDHFLFALNEGGQKFSELTVNEQRAVLLRAQELKTASEEIG